MNGFLWRITDLQAPADRLIGYYLALERHKSEDLRHERAMAGILGYDADAWVKYKKEQWDKPPSRIKIYDYQHINSKLRRGRAKYHKERDGRREAGGNNGKSHRN